MKREKAFFVGTNKNSHRCGEPAEIIGVCFITPDGLDRRLCYHVRWIDGTEDFMPEYDSINYKIIKASDIVVKVKDMGI